MSMTVWLAGFAVGVAGSLMHTAWLYYVGGVLAVLGILLIHIESKDKKVWRLLVDLLVMTP